MAKVNTLNGVTGKDLVAMNKQVLDVTKKVPVNLEDVTHGLYIINSAGIMGAKGIDMVTNASKLAIAGLGTVPQAADMMSSVFNVFNKEGLKASEIANKLALVVKLGKTHIDQMSEGFGSASVIVQNAGIKLDEFLASVSALTIMGSTASEAYTEISGATVALLKPTSTMQKVFHQLGVKDGRTLIKTMGGMVPAMQAINKEIDKLHLSGAKAWGRKQGFMADLALTGNAHGHFVENLAAMKNEPSALDKMFTTMLDTTDAKWQLLKNNLRIFAIDIGTKLLPVLSKLMDEFTPILNSITDWMDRNPGWTANIVKTVGAIAGLLLVISPLATAVGLAADGMRLYTLWSAKSVMTASALVGPLEAEAATMGVMATNLGVAGANAKGLLATLGEFAIPAAVVSFVGYKALQGIHKDISDRHAELSAGFQNYYDYADSKSPNRFIDQNWKYWNDRRAQKSMIAAENQSAANGFRIIHPIDQTHTKLIDSLSDQPTTKPTIMPVTGRLYEDNQRAKDTTVHIYVHDTTGSVKDVRATLGSNQVPIAVKITSTHGQR